MSSNIPSIPQPPVQQIYALPLLSMCHLSSRILSSPSSNPYPLSRSQEGCRRGWRPASSPGPALAEASERADGLGRYFPGGYTASLGCGLASEPARRETRPRRAGVREARPGRSGGCRQGRGSTRGAKNSWRRRR
jgi:hypothetical protein